MPSSLRKLALGLALAVSLTAGAYPRAKVTLGDDTFLAQTWNDLAGRCVGIITNQTGVTSAVESFVDAARRNPKICIKALFSPEHGLRGDQPASEYVASYTDARTGLPVYSLYGKTRRPTPEMLSGIDVLLFDIQDVGSRTYTYISTMAYAMEAAAQSKKEMWILDRPNPIGGEAVEGPVLDPKFKSFIGLYPIALRHGMTVGELAQLFNERFEIHAKLRVVPMRGWKRSMLWADTGLPWVQSSPNIPDATTTIFYPCTGLVDTAGINNAAGSAKPFAYAGAFGLDAQRYADALNARNLPGVYFRAASWTTFGGFWVGKTLSGVELVVYDPRAFSTTRTAVELIVAARAIAPRIAVIKSDHAMDIDWGTDTLRTRLATGASAEQIVHGWDADVAAFKATRAKYLLYE